MKRRSVAGFIFGLIGSLFCLWWGFTFGLVGDIGQSIVNGVNGSGTWGGTISIIMILGWLAFVGAIVGIIGAAMCFKSARKGGIVMSIATLACGALQIYLFANVVGSGTPIMTMVFLFLLPVILMIAGDVSALLAKEVVDNQTYGNRYAQPTYQPNQYSQPQQTYAQQPQQTYAPQPQAKTLEQELTELKGMFEKGLLTEEEFNAAKANAIAKHTK